jgi:hypothetical protein
VWSRALLDLTYYLPKRSPMIFLTPLDVATGRNQGADGWEAAPSHDVATPTSLTCLPCVLHSVSTFSMYDLDP